MAENGEIRLELRDGEWPFTYTDHDRQIVRAIVVDDAGYYYFVRAEREDDFGASTLIETSGGGVEPGEALEDAIRRELLEELGAQVEILCKLGVVSDYYNLIHRHNINHYFLCRLVSLGERHLTLEERERFHLSVLRLDYEQAVAEYRRRANTPLGRLIANRELPILKRAGELAGGRRTRVDLITGFLGAGKTTFIHRYLKGLAGEKVRVIENEFGSIGVDTGFLRNEDCEIEDLSGVCMCCRGKDRFIAMLSEAAEQGCDRVLVEPSGIYDVDEFFSVMNDPAVRRGCRIGSILAVVDARLPEDLSDESLYLLLRQLQAAGKVVVSKVQMYPPGTFEATLAELNDLIRATGGERTIDPKDVVAADWDALTDEDFASLWDCGFRQEAHERRSMNHEELFGTALVGGFARDEADLRSRLDDMLTDPRFGRVLRVKGYIRDMERNWYEVNCTRGERSVRPAPNVRRGVLVVVGQNLDETALEAEFKGIRH